MAARRSSAPQQSPAPIYAAPPGFMMISEENFARLTNAATQTTAQAGLNVDRHYNGLTLAQESMAKTIAQFEHVSAEKDRRIGDLQTQVATKDREIAQLRSERAEFARDAQKDEAELRKVAMQLEERRRTIEGVLGFVRGPGKDLALLLLAPDRFASSAVLGALGGGAPPVDESPPAAAPPPEIPVNGFEVQEWRAALVEVFASLSDETLAHMRSQFGSVFRSAALAPESSPLRELVGRVLADVGPARVERLMKHTVAACDQERER